MPRRMTGDASQEDRRRRAGGQATPRRMTMRCAYVCRIVRRGPEQNAPRLLRATVILSEAKDP
jgi:hypothetical protein